MAADRFDHRDCSDGGQIGLSHGLIRTCSNEIILVDTVLGIPRPPWLTAVGPDSITGCRRWRRG
jgi:hypothetical protein